MKKTLKLLILIVLISTFVLSVMMIKVNAETTEGTEGGEGTGNTQFYLEEEKITVKLSSTRYLNYRNKPTGENIVWTSSNSNVATVEDGVVTGKSIGKTTITAKVGEQEDTCEVSVEYYSLTINSNEEEKAQYINLVLKEHPTETLKAKVEDAKYQEIANAEIAWKSSDTKVATVDNNGNVTAIGVGKTTITAEAVGVFDTIEVNVSAEPEFTDFDKAKYEIISMESNFGEKGLKISGITPKNNNLLDGYYYIITDNNTRPTLEIEKNGEIKMIESKAKILKVNTDENYLYSEFMNEHLELNQELYLWVIQNVYLDTSYYNGENAINYATKFVVEGEKLTRPKLPQLNVILEEFDLRSEYTKFDFEFPCATDNRKFSVKIGRVTDNAILKKIQNNDYSGITELQAYAKNDKGVFSTSLTTNKVRNYFEEKALFDGSTLLVDDAYYYVHVVFDDENGKYYPVEGISLGQAHIDDEHDDHWILWAYTNEKFEWNNLESTYEGSEYEEKEETKKEETKQEEIKKDETVVDKEIPKAGASNIIVIAVMMIVVGAVVTYKKYNKYKGI